MRLLANNHDYRNPLFYYPLMTQPSSPLHISLRDMGWEIHMTRQQETASLDSGKKENSMVETIVFPQKAGFR